MVKQALAARGYHARAADADKLGIGVLFFDGFDEVRAEQVTRGFACGQGDDEWLGHDGF